MKQDLMTALKNWKPEEGVFLNMGLTRKHIPLHTKEIPISEKRNFLESVQPNFEEALRIAIDFAWQYHHMVNKSGNITEKALNNFLNHHDRNRIYRNFESCGINLLEFHKASSYYGFAYRDSAERAISIAFDAYIANCLDKEADYEISHNEQYAIAEKFREIGATYVNMALLEQQLRLNFETEKLGDRKITNLYLVKTSAFWRETSDKPCTAEEVFDLYQKELAIRAMIKSLGKEDEFLASLADKFRADKAKSADIDKG